MIILPFGSQEAGRDFATAGTINQADDLVFLTLAEVELLSGENHPTAVQKGWKTLIAERRAVY